MPFSIVRQDITKLQVDAVVNAANTDLLMGGGVCGAIFEAAGADELQAACDALAPIHVGEAVITPGFALPASYVIHTAGPVYADYSPKESERLLRDSYRNSLALAAEKGCESVAFPLISSGIYGYPKKAAMNIAMDEIRIFLAEHDTTVYLTVFDRDAFAISLSLLGAVESYIDETYVDGHMESRRNEKLNRTKLTYLTACESISLPCPDESPELEDILNGLDEPFSETLLRLIDKKGKTDVEVYKRANIDRKLFSKIRTGKGYVPKKRTILALAVALELTLDETDRLLECAGYALSHSQKGDVIVEYFIINKRYDIFELNEVLFRFDLPLLGCS